MGGEKGFETEGFYLLLFLPSYPLFNKFLFAKLCPRQKERGGEKDNRNEGKEKRKGEKRGEMEKRGRRRKDRRKFLLQASSSYSQPSNSQVSNTGD